MGNMFSTTADLASPPHSVLLSNGPSAPTGYGAVQFLTTNDTVAPQIIAADAVVVDGAELLLHVAGGRLVAVESAPGTYSAHQCLAKAELQVLTQHNGGSAGTFADTSRAVFRSQRAMLHEWVGVLRAFVATRADPDAAYSQIVFLHSQATTPRVVPRISMLTGATPPAGPAAMMHPSADVVRAIAAAPTVGPVPTVFAMGRYDDHTKDRAVAVAKVQVSTGALLVDAMANIRLLDGDD
jgi:hypothetical protein